MTTLNVGARYFAMMWTPVANGEWGDVSLVTGLTVISRAATLYL